jgi:ABC-2 type transport system ATP-binding protein
VRGLVKRYGDSTAVADLDLDIRRGEIFALLGPNGAGKTTTVEILEGYRRRDGGDVRVLGVDPADGGRRWKADIGIVLQSGAGDSQLSCLELLRAQASYYADPRDPAEVLDLVGLTEKAGARGRSLSGGQRRRLDVALGIVGRPRLLFLDEPTTGFDPQARRSFWELVRGLQHDGTTIVLTTHYLDEAAHLADRVGVIAGGRMVGIGAVDEIGGRETRVPLVRWRDGGELRELRTDHPATHVARLVAAGEGNEPEDVEIVRPTLEDVYLSLIAHPTDSVETVSHYSREEVAA